MNIYKDYCFDQSLLKNFIGKEFIKYKADAFLFTNSVTGIVGLYIDDKILILKNEQETVDYYGAKDDMAIFKIEQGNEDDVHSFFADTEQITTPINEKITSITLVNEKQIVEFDDKKYETDLTRAIIFHCISKDICFQKDMTAFSEEIEIKKGYDLVKEYPKRNDFFEEGWKKGIKYKYKQTIIKI